ncbi:putative lipid II flippase FtsW [Brockia lithotrophica]|uniref:Probable peptidoglycan glycosyltransferase FtsW n=1 Tax=Brockia lithotrophica TaxID=933949 RepID=A0A660L4X0_9BACL|nr:putative lipid II flippase FtsW [Brockia lithotrophica]RKQ88468.1 cell division-specific peptidoglycan biosynthesis regulator FtsW [Brockia lithotrophica]
MSPRKGFAGSEKRTAVSPGPDYVLLLLTVLLVIFGLTMVWSASLPEVQLPASSRSSATTSAFHFLLQPGALNWAERQLLWAGLGSVVLVVAMHTPLRLLRKLIPLALAAAYAFLVLVLIPHVGTEVNGSRSWLRFGGLSFQPSEFAKLALLMYLAAFVANRGDRIAQFRRGFLPPLLVGGSLAFLVLLENDLGTAAILLGTTLVVLYLSGADLRHLLFVGVVSAAGVALAVFFVPYRMNRFFAFLDPWSDPQGRGYHLIQSLYAIAHGRLVGVGLGYGTQKAYYLPYAHNDFIFAVVLEELGAIGGALLLFLLASLVLRIAFLAARTDDPFARTLAYGIATSLSIQTMFNLGGVTGLLPITGVTLPFISYGGTSLVLSLGEVGIALAISRLRRVSG